MLTRLIVAGLWAGSLMSAELPAWFRAFPKLQRLESRFVQESDSAVFGKLRREGTLRLASGGRLRVEYRKGMVLVADGKSLIQYDPSAHTAQRVNLRSASAEAPMLTILVNPAALDQVFSASAGPGPDQVTLTSRRPGQPGLVLEGQGQLLSRIRWTDGTGAKQVIELQGAKVPASLDPALFTFIAPAGTRWLGAH